jgi:hypothetical protein
MQRLSCHFARLWTLSVLCLGLFGAPCLAAAPDVATKVTASRQAASLVQAALDAEEAGDAAKRATLLEQALQVDPEYAEARWQSGQVKFEGEWRSLAEIELLVSKEQRYVEYRDHRDSLEGTPEDHEELARYCRAKGLNREARYHWANVLLAIPDHAEAKKALRLVNYRDGLYVKEDVVELESQARHAAQRLKRELPRMTKLCHEVTRGTDEQRAAALTAIGSISEVGVMAALEQAADTATAKSADHAAELYGAIVEALADMPQHEATLRLLNYAVFSDSIVVRRRAAEALRPRSETDYVPLLMATLTGEVDVETEVVVLASGTVRLIEKVKQAGPLTRRAAPDANGAAVATSGNIVPTSITTGGGPSRALSRAANLAATTQNQARLFNAEADEMNRRVAAVLNVTAGTRLDATPQLLWQQWQEFNELKFDIEAEEVNIYVTNINEPSYKACFAPGTPVWTQTGKRAIEKIVSGDLVLSQNPATGELDYRPVLRTTLGDPTEVKTLMVGKDRITATLGHRFWVGGRGWQMAKFLKPSTRLHSLHGPVAIEAVESADDMACHNLVVEGFHTYFVGESKLLVHDLECPRPAPSGLPGSAKARNLLPPDPSMQTARVVN